LSNYKVNLILYTKSLIKGTPPLLFELLNPPPPKGISPLGNF